MAVSGDGPRLAEPPRFELSRSVPLAGRLRFVTERPCRCVVELESAEGREPVPVDAARRTAHDIAVLGLRPDRDYRLRLTISDTEGTTAAEPIEFRTSPLPDDFPTLRLARSQPERIEPGVTLFSVFRWKDDVGSKTFGLFVAVDASGDVVWYYRVGSPAAALHVLPGGDFQFIHGQEPKNIRTINRLGETVREFRAVALESEVPEEVIPVDVDTFHHDFAPLPDGGLFALTTEVRRLERFPRSVTRPRRGFAAAHVVGDVIVQVSPDGQVTERWPLLDRLDPLRVSYDSHDGFWNERAYAHIEGGTKDWSHANAIVRDPRDGGIIVSLRHQDAVIKLDGETGDVRWILGTRAGWRPPLSRKVLRPTHRIEWPFHQHGVKLTPRGTLLMYDNGNLRAIPPARATPPAASHSRAVEFEVDEEAMTVTQVWSYGGGPGEETFYSPFLCDADWLPQTGNILITDGARVTDDDGLPVNTPPGDQQWARLLEVTYGEDPQVVWELIVDDRATRPDLGWSIYRAERLPGLYPNATSE